MAERRRRLSPPSCLRACCRVDPSHRRRGLPSYSQVQRSILPGQTHLDLDPGCVALQFVTARAAELLRAPTPSGNVGASIHQLELLIKVEVIDPAVTGTTNVLKACYEAKVRRVVVVSSVAVVLNNPNCPKGKPFDEDCWSGKEYCRKNEVMQLSLSKAMPLLVLISMAIAEAPPTQTRP